MKIVHQYLCEYRISTESRSHHGYVCHDEVGFGYRETVFGEDLGET